MFIALALILALHGAIHLMGFAKGFGFAELPQLRTPISRTRAVFWLLAALLFVAAAVMTFASPLYWWLPTLAAVVLSQILILGSWRDAKLGTIANVVLLLAALFAGFVGVESTLPGGVK